MPVVEKIVAKKYKVLIDEEDLPLANHGRGWGYNSGRVVVWFGRRKSKLLHRVILGALPGQHVDHINGNPLDNRRSNIRICTREQNMMNRRPNNPATKVEKHGFKGVVRNRKPGLLKPFRAALFKGDKQYCSRYCRTPEEAARAYDELARKHHGEFARLNFPDT